MKKIKIALVATSIAFAGLVGSNICAKTQDQDKKDIMVTMTSCCKEKCVLEAAMRKLWEDHITYTRNYIISALANLPDSDEIVNRLMQNQDDIGKAIAPYYGKEASAKLASLLRDHIKIASEVVAAAKEGNKATLKDVQQKWHVNADEITSFLSSANPNWSKKDLTNMLYKHLDFTTNEVVARLNKTWKSDIAAYDKGHAHMLMFSDMLIDGITKQFPEKFGMKSCKK